MEEVEEETVEKVMEVLEEKESNGEIEGTSSHNNMSLPPHPSITGINSRNLLFDLIHHHSYAMFAKLCLECPDAAGTHKVLASLFLHDRVLDRAKVISLATGNKCIKYGGGVGAGLPCRDSDSKRVPTVRWMYSQIELYSRQPKKSVLCINEKGTKLKIRDRYSLHLFISTAPCGDGRVYQLSSKMGNDQTKLRNVGYLRHKIEGGEGTVLGQEVKGESLSVDAMIEGQRLRTMSCSDKILKWNVAGLQGALLSHFVDPIYMSSLSLAHLYRRSCVSRACFSRLSSFHPSPPFLLNSSLHCARSHSLAAPLPFPPPKSVSTSLNWNASDGKVELVDTQSGRSREGLSRLSKRQLFSRFSHVNSMVNSSPVPSSLTYLSAKRAAVDYCQVVMSMKEFLSEHDMGEWKGKPSDFSLFTLP